MAGPLIVVAICGFVSYGSPIRWLRAVFAFAIAWSLAGSVFPESGNVVRIAAGAMR